MDKSRRYILMTLAAGCAAAGIALASGAGGDDGRVAAMQRALASLDVERYSLAERQATELAGEAAGEPDRAWSIVAAARFRRGEYAGAMRAYRLVLASCDSRRTREHALKQIAACRRELEPEKPAPTVSQRLDAQQIAELSEVREQTYVESSEHFLVRARNPKLAKLVADQAESALTRICRMVLAGRAYPHSVEINVWTDAEQYAANAVSAPEWSGGSYSLRQRDGYIIRRIDLTQLDENGQFSPLTVDRILPHEMCHLVLRELFGDSHCPLYLNEGLAMLAEAEIDNHRVVLAGVAISGEAKIPLDELLVHQRHDAAGPVVFYAEAFSFTHFLHRRMSREQFAEFLEHVRAGCSTTDAIQRAMHIPHDTDFGDQLADAWEADAIDQAQIIRALQGDELAANVAFD